VTQLLVGRWLFAFIYDWKDSELDLTPTQLTVNFPSSDTNNVRDSECLALISRTRYAQLTTNDERRTSN